MMRTFTDVIDRWPSLSDLGADTGDSYGVVKQWRRRNSIPADRWLAVVTAAERRGIAGVTLAALATIAAAQRHGTPIKQGEAA